MAGSYALEIVEKTVLVDFVGAVLDVDAKVVLCVSQDNIRNVFNDNVLRPAFLQVAQERFAHVPHWPKKQ
jgi:hypothetical protein